jgi:hypothetical protein
MRWVEGGEVEPAVRVDHSLTVKDDALPERFGGLGCLRKRSRQVPCTAVAAGRRLRGRRDQQAGSHRIVASRGATCRYGFTLADLDR